MVLTIALAIKYGLIKWYYAKKTGVGFRGLETFTDNHPKLKNFNLGCAICDLPNNNDCSQCVLAIVWGGSCGKDVSTYRKWCNARTVEDRKKYAGQMCEDIKRIKQ